MHRKRRLGKRRKTWWFGTVVRALTLTLAGAMVFAWGCSEREDNQTSEQHNRVVIAIRKPMPKPPQEEKASPKPPLQRKEGAVEGLKAEPGVSGEETSRGAERVPEPEQPQSVPPVPAKPVADETTVAEEPARKPEPPKLEEGFIRVREGESLSAVAARTEVYDDFLKWPRLYELNRDRLPMIQTWDDIKNKPLPSGFSLRYVGPADEKGEGPSLKGKPWVVTVRSRQTPGRLADPAIKLIKMGFHVYIARAVVKEKKWLRLRVGFFRKKADALAAQEKIGKILGNADAWIGRAGTSEFEEYRMN